MHNEILMNSIVNDKLGGLYTKKIISKLNDEFSLYDFILKFSEEYESEYIEMLFVYKGKEAFKTVNEQIASYLNANKDSLGIENIDRTESEIIFRSTVEAEFWKKK